MACEECNVLQQAVSRRSFVKAGGLALLALGTLGPLALWRDGGFGGVAAPPPGAGQAAGAGGRVLVVVQMAGGNDGLNTVVPAGQGAYYDRRPTIAVPEKDLLPLASGLGLHPSLKRLKGLFDKGHLAVVQGAGYPHPNRSHFVSTRIWESADPTGRTYNGWIGRFLDGIPHGGPVDALAVGPNVPLTLQGSRAHPVAIETLDGLDVFNARQRKNPAVEAVMSGLRRMYGDVQAQGMPMLAAVRGAAEQAYTGAALVQHAAAQPYKPGTTYPKTPLASSLQLVARLIAGGMPTRVYHVLLGGFDDHANEDRSYARVLDELDGAVGAFLGDLQVQGDANRVALMTWSEFGRRVKENASGGTDHGTAGPMFVAGGAVKGGLYGETPSVTRLDANGDLIHDTDFRQVYGTLLDRWLGADPEKVLGGSFKPLAFV